MATQKPSIAIIVVPGVGDHPAGETVDQMATALAASSERYDWAAKPDPGILAVPVRAEGDRSGERYEAARRSLVLDDEVPVDLIEMRWSDLSSFPKNGLRAFFAAAFGLALQIATAGLEAAPPEGLNESRPALAEAPTELEPPRRGPANVLMEAASWWAASIVIPITLVAALAGTALWLAVDEPLGINDWLAVVGVVVIGFGCVRLLGKGIAAGGWKYPPILERVVSPQRAAMTLFLTAIGIGIWRGIVTESVEGGLGQTVLAVAGYGVRPAWMIAAVLVFFAIVALARRPLGWPARYTALLTTVVSPLLVALIGTILVGGIGAVAFGSAEDATWGSTAPDVRCFATPASWEWTDECAGDSAVKADWPALAGNIPLRLDAADDDDAQAAEDRVDGTLNGDDGKLQAAEDAAEKATRTRDAAGAVEDDVAVAPTTWAQGVFEIAVLPLVPVVLLILLVLGLAILWTLVLVPLDTWLDTKDPNPRGGRLTRALLGFTGVAGTWTVGAVGALGCVIAFAFWSISPLWNFRDDPTGGTSSMIWASLAALLLGALVLARLVPIDVRNYKETIGGALEKVRGGLDIAYDVATYLRIDSGSGIRSSIVARYRGLLAAVEDDHTHIVIAAHSQGSMYSIATIFGDEARRDRVLPWDLVREGGPTGPRFALLTFGCPIRQTYGARLPGQYDWIGENDLQERLDSLALPGWVNAYRPRDYIGRRVFTAGLTPDEIKERTGRYRFLLRSGVGRRILLDVCIPGEGSHTGYFGDPELAKWLNHVVVGSLDPATRPPDDYRLTPAG